MSRNVMLRHVASCRVMSHYVTSFHVILRHVMSCHVMSRQATSCHVMYLMSRHATSCHVTSCHVTSRHVTSCHVLPRHVTSRHVTSCYVISRRKSRDGHTTNASLSTDFFHTQSIQIKHDRVRWLSRRLPIPYRISGIWSSLYYYWAFLLIILHVRWRTTPAICVVSSLRHEALRLLIARWNEVSHGSNFIYSNYFYLNQQLLWTLTLVLLL